MCGDGSLSMVVCQVLDIVCLVYCWQCRIFCQTLLFCGAKGVHLEWQLGVVYLYGGGKGGIAARW